MKDDRHKTKTQLIEELTELRRQNAEVEGFNAQCRRDKPFTEYFKDEWERTFDAVPDLIAVTDKEYRLLKVNKAMAERLGMSKEELHGRYCYEMVHALKAPPHFCPHTKLLDDGASHYCHINEPRLSGYFTISVSPLFDTDRHVIGAIHVARDITESKQFEQELSAYKEQLEKTVEKHTTELELTNQQLQQEILERKQIETALQKSEQRFRDISFNLADWIWEVNAQGEYTFVSESVKQALGYDAEELLGKSPFDLMPEDEAARIRDIFLGILGARAPIVDLENWNLSKNGDRICLLTNGIPLLDREGNFVGYRGVDKDVTKRKKAEEAHRASEENYRRLFEGAHDSIFIVDPATRRFLDVNQIAATRLGYTRDELLNLDLNDINPKMSNGKNEAIITELLEQGSVIFEHEQIRKDGSEIPVEISSHLIEYNGRKAWQSIVRDITERKRVELELRKLQRAVEQSASSIVISDQHGTIEYINPAFCERTGYSQKETIGQNPCILKSGKHPPEFYRHLWQTLSQGETWQGEFINKRKDGELYWESAKISPIKNKGGRITHYLAIKDDITERRLAEKELQKAKLQAEAANKAKSEFLANMSHELRTPLNGILGYAQILKRAENLTEKQQHGLSIIQQSGEHLLTLIDDILDLSKIEAGKLELELAPFPLLDSLNIIMELIRLRAHQKGLECSYEASSELPRAIYSDGKYLRQILLNLLGNAVKFTEQGYIKLRVTQRSQAQGLKQIVKHQLRFEIEDSGIGIPAEQLEKIFSPFERGQTARLHAEGTGLGLSISQHLVHMLGSTLQVKSVIGKGSRFWFDLEVSASEELKFEEQGRRRLAAYHAEKTLSILLVDDKAHNRAVVRELLSAVGFRTIEAENGRDALEKTRRLRPDLIIMDLVMPVMTGFEATRELRKDPEFATLPIVALSADAFKENKQAGLEAGCNDFLAKPFSEQDLFEIIGRRLTLEWIYEHAVEPQKEPLADVSITPPPPAILHSLNEMASIGDIIGIRESIAKFEAQYPESDVFFSRLRQLAAELRLIDIQEYLRCYLEK